MKQRTIWTIAAACLAVALGGAGLASAGEESKASEQRRHAIQGRDFVWKAPSEKPYALTGEARAEATREREEERAPGFAFRGRSGIEYRR